MKKLVLTLYVLKRFFVYSGFNVKLCSLLPEFRKNCLTRVTRLSVLTFRSLAQEGKTFLAL